MRIWISQPRMDRQDGTGFWMLARSGTALDHARCTSCNSCRSCAAAPMTSERLTGERLGCKTHRLVAMAGAAAGSIGRTPDTPDLYRHWGDSIGKRRRNSCPEACLQHARSHSSAGQCMRDRQRVWACRRADHDRATFTRFSIMLHDATCILEVAQSQSLSSREDC